MTFQVILVVSAVVCSAWAIASSGKKDGMGTLTLPTPGTVKQLTSADIASFLNKHREYRASPTSGAANMEAISWDSNLAQKAADWVSTCLFHHPHSNDEDESEFKTPGQNLYWNWASDANSGPTPEAIITKWHNEDQWYDINANTCSAPSGKTCNHYLQVVWAKTQKVGCGMAFCQHIIQYGADRGKGYVFACDYGTGVTTGKAPYIPGAACTQCQSGIGYCVDNTCVGSCSDQDASCSCEANCNGNGVLDADACTCACNDGFTGADCSKDCIDTNVQCGASAGWPFSWCALYLEDKESYSYMEQCPKFCQWCQP